MKEIAKKSMLACVLALLLGPAYVAPGATVVYPPNDLCEAATPIGDVTNLPFNTTGARFGGRGLCMTGPNIWYRYTAACTGDVTVSLAGSSYDTMLAVYNGSACYPTADRLIACNDDAHSSYQSEIVFAAIAGNQYLIEVGGYGPAQGRGVITVRCQGQPGPPPSKDDCPSATPIGEVQNLSFDTTNAAFDGPGLCMVGPNIWYCYTASCTGEVTVSLAGSLYDTMLAVYNGCQCYPASNDLIACNDDVNGTYQSAVTFAAVAGNQYLIEIGGYGRATGRGVLNIACQGQPGPPANKDDCASARSVGEVTNVPFDTTNATFDGRGLCMNGPNIWFRYTASCSGQVTVSLLGSGYDTMLAAYRGANCNPTQNDLIACNDDFSSSYQSQLVFDAVAGNQYLIEIGGYGRATGQGVLSITCEGSAVADKPDLGDAPDSTNNSGKVMRAYSSAPSIQARFPTVFTTGSGSGPHGPLHLNEQAVAFLGRAITAEAEADTGPDEDGVNNLRPATNSADNDGGDDAVQLPLSLPNCGMAAIDYTVTVVQPGTDLWVNVWLDFNRDGDWDDAVDCPGGRAKEWAVQNQLLFDLPAGLHHLTTPGFLSAHPADRPEQIWMRITLSEQPWTGGSNPGAPGNAGSGPAEKYLIGETEDYYFVPQTTGQTDCPLCQDVDGDGTINLQDLTAYINQWLANCQ